MESSSSQISSSRMEGFGSIPAATLLRHPVADFVHDVATCELDGGGLIVPLTPSSRRAREPSHFVDAHGENTGVCLGTKRNRHHILVSNESTIASTTSRSSSELTAARPRSR